MVAFRKSLLLPAIAPATALQATGHLGAGLHSLEIKSRARVVTEQEDGAKIGRLMRKQGSEALQTPEVLVKGQKQPRVMTAVASGGSKLVSGEPLTDARDSNGPGFQPDISYGVSSSQSASDEFKADDTLLASHDITWGTYMFDKLSGTNSCKQDDASDDAKQSVFEKWSGTASGLTIGRGDGKYNVGNQINDAHEGLRIYKSACPDATTKVVGGKMMIPASTSSIELIFGITETCTGECSPLMVSLWKPASAGGGKVHRWCWNHQPCDPCRTEANKGCETDPAIACDTFMTTDIKKWTREVLDISNYMQDDGSQLQMNLEVYTAGDWRNQAALSNEVGVGGRASVIIDSILLGPIATPASVPSITDEAQMCREILSDVCDKNSWCQDKYVCKSGYCVTGSARCNGARNCDDDSDEVGCDVDGGFLGTYFLRHAQKLIDGADTDNFDLVDSLTGPDLRSLKQKLDFDHADFLKSVRGKEYFAAKFTGNLTIENKGLYSFNPQANSKAKVNLTLTQIGGDEVQHNITESQWVNLKAGTWEVTVRYVNYNSDKPMLKITFMGPDTEATPVVLGAAGRTTTVMTGARCATMTCGVNRGLSAKPGAEDILCQGVPCNQDVDTAVCCQHDFKAISAGDDQTCALDREGRPVCWGDSGDQWKVEAGPFLDISTRGDFTCGVKQADNSVECWKKRGLVTTSIDLSAGGLISSLALGVGHISALRDTKNAACKQDPSIMPEAQTDIKRCDIPSNIDFEQIVAGDYYTCGIKDLDHKILCWGDNSQGQAPGESVSGGIEVDGATRAYLTIGAGKKHACAVSEGSCAAGGLTCKSGRVYCWGENGQGQATPPTGLNDIEKVAPGGGHTCALKENGVAVCWGDNTDGQATPPKDEEGNDMKFESISSGNKHSCGLLRADSVMLGTSETAAQQQSGNETDPNCCDPAVDETFRTTAVDGAVVCWGSNYASDGTWRGMTQVPQAGFWPN